MLYALVDGEKVLATPARRGYCPICNGEVTAVCSPKQYMINHWRHLAETNCDPWKRGETDWHLNWKSRFPKHRTEVVLYDAITGEKHQADVRTKDETVIEFQNSPLSEQELESRIAFYRKLVWVVNGLADPLVYSYFKMELKRRPKNAKLADFAFWGRSKFMHKWSRSTTHVFIDFGTDVLYWLKKYDAEAKTGMVQIISKTAFLEKYAIE